MHIIVLDPDNFLGSPAYDGPATDAWRVLRSGAYAASTEAGEPATLLVIRSSHGTGSSAAHVHRSTTEV